MSAIAPQSWLPANAIDTAAHALPMREAIAEWSAKWFANGSARLLGVEVVNGDGRPAGVALELEDGLVVTVPEPARDAIDALMFGDHHGVATTADRAAIATATDKALADLRTRVAQLVGLSTDAAWRSRLNDVSPIGYCFRVGLGSASQPLAITIARTLLAGMIMARLRPAPTGAPLGAIDAGLAPHPITVSALLGTSHLAMGELTALCPGDVVVLDSALTDPATLVIDRQRQSAWCRIVAGDHHLDLILA